jgi:hypothetical protein
VTSFLTSGMGGIGGAGTPTTDTRALQEINSQNKTFVNKDFTKNIAWLNNSVDTLSAWSQKLQSGVDQANQNAFEQVQGIFADFFVMFAGLEPTGIDPGDLKYVLQGIGALLGINPDTPFPINLLEAGWHLFSNYIVPGPQFLDVIFDAVDAWGAELGLSPEFMTAMNNLKDAFENLWTAIDTDLNGLFDALSKLLAAFMPSINSLGPLIDGLVNLIDLIPWDVLTPLLQLLADLGIPFINALTTIVNAGTAFLDPLSFISGSQIGSLGTNFAPNTVKDTTLWSVGAVGAEATAWTWDAAQSAFTTLGNGSIKEIHTQKTYPANPGAKLTVKGSLRWIGIPSGANDFGVQLQWFLDANPVSVTNFDIPSGHGAAGGFTQSVNVTDVVVPVSVNGVKIAARVGPGISTGQVWAKDFSAQLQGGVSAGLLEGLLNLINIPGLPAAQIISGIFGGSLIPGLDASKIVSGQFAQSMVVNLEAQLADLYAQVMKGIITSFAGVQSLVDQAFQAMFGGSSTGNNWNNFLSTLQNIPGLNIVSTFLASVVPGLDASKITSGLFPQSMVNGLVALLNAFPGGNIIGTLLSSVIPGLDASKITSGLLGLPQIPNLPASQVTSGTFLTSLIPNLNASIINAGTFIASLIPGLDASKISSGIFSLLQIPNLPASQVTSGTFGSGFIPGLDASKIISGLFSQSQVTNLPTDLASKLPTNVFNASAQAGPNIVLGPTFEDSTIVRNFAAGAGSGYSTEQKHGGTQSFKIVSAGGWDELDLAPIAGGTFAQDSSKSLKVVAGQKYFVSVWCFAKSTNVGANNAGIDVFYTDSTGVNPVLYTTLNGVLTNVPVGAWKQISGYSTVPAGYDRMLPYFFTDNPTTVGNVWYVDDADVHDETAVQNVVQNLWGSVGSIGATSANLAPNPSFTTDISGWTFWDWGAATLGVWDGTQGHSANGSLKLPFSGGSGQSAADLTFPCVPGQSFSISLWAKQDANSGGGYIGVYTGDATGKGFGTAADTTHNLGNAATGWTQHNYTFTAPANCYTMIIEAASQTSGAAGNLWIDDVVVQQTNMLTPAVTPNALGDIPRLVNALFQGFIGSPSPATSLTDAIMAVQRQFNQTVSNTKAIQTLQSVATAGANSGTTVTVDFGSYADGPMPSVFTVTYSGTGTSRLGVTNGQANWATLVNDADVSASVRYNVAPTATDFQIIRGTMTQAPNDGGISGNPRIYVRGRVNAADNSFVWARARSIGWMLWQADIGCTVAGVETVWVSNITLPWNLNMYFKVGVGVNPRVYELWSGDQMVYSHTEVGTTSQLGSSNRYWGAISQMRKGNFNAITSGMIGATAVSDNAPVAVQGSHAHMNRTGTGTVNLTGGSVWTLLPASFFGATLRASSDITPDLVNGKFTVTKAGPYQINVRIRLSSSVAALVYVGLYKNGVLDQVSDFWFPGDTSAESIGGHFNTYLSANDNVQIATFSTGVTVTVLTGEATGTQTFFNITKGATT